MTTLNEYNGIKIIREAVHPQPKYKWADAEYRKKEHVIVLFDRFDKLSKERQARTLRHEYAHAVWFKIPRTYKTIWKLISNGKLIKLMNAFGLTKYTSNAWIRDYAKRNHLEDFAVSVEYEDECRNNFSDDKCKWAKSLLAKYRKGV